MGAVDKGRHSVGTPRLLSSSREPQLPTETPSVSTLTRSDYLSLVLSS